MSVEIYKTIQISGGLRGGAIAAPLGVSPVFGHAHMFAGSPIIVD